MTSKETQSRGRFISEVDDDEALSHGLNKIREALKVIETINVKSSRFLRAKAFLNFESFSTFQSF